MRKHDQEIVTVLLVIAIAGFAAFMYNLFSREPALIEQLRGFLS